MVKKYLLIIIPKDKRRNYIKRFCIPETYRFRIPNSFLRLLNSEIAANCTALHKLQGKCAACLLWRSPNRYGKKRQNEYLGCILCQIPCTPWQFQSHFPFPFIKLLTFGCFLHIRHNLKVFTQTCSTTYWHFDIKAIN